MIYVLVASSCLLLRSHSAPELLRAPKLTVVTDQRSKQQDLLRGDDPADRVRAVISGIGAASCCNTNWRGASTDVAGSEKGRPQSCNSVPPQTAKPCQFLFLY